MKWRVKHMNTNDLFEGKAFVITGGAGSFVFTGLIDAH